MTDKEKLEKLKKLADAMYYAAQYLTTDASRLHKAMDKYHKFIIHECKEEPVSEDILDVSRIDYRLQHKSIEDGIKYHAEEYSFNIESVLYNQLTNEQQELWRKELERAVISGGYYGLELSKDKRYKENSVSEDLLDTTQTITYNGEVYTRCYKDKLDAFACKYPLSVPKPSKRYAKYSDVDLTIAVIEGAKWQKEHLWKPADGDDLPEIDREVIAILDNGKVVFAHRPPEYWDGKDIITGKVTRNYPKTYGKGGWNIPDVKFWLDVELPKEIEI